MLGGEGRDGKFGFSVLRCGVRDATHSYVFLTSLRRIQPNSPQAPLEIANSGEVDGQLAIKIDNSNAFKSTSDLSFASRVVLNGAPLEMKGCGAGGWVPVAVAPISPEVRLIALFFSCPSAFRSSHAFFTPLKHSANVTNRPPPSSNWASPRRSLRKRPKKSSRQRTRRANPSFCSKSARALTACCRGVTRCGTSG